ncbi:hypothetical protein MIND_00517700 [Mycena indigotica]|uniref:Uncharacterized protein n=1 Tax=Mycena indigotica TaxID=2126181 RepID=A0A8H6T0I5_9AGAR|nr:uncharacterized protein MIND_00517700 [Mycena indigotica]KAF7307240.1 hypothetical protein MIND_00517700 [Mycena indigotica]
MTSSSSTSDDNEEKAKQIAQSMKADVAALSELLSKETLDESGEASIEELLARLENADGVAKGVENKLDALLGNLDSLLDALETTAETEPAQAAEKKQKPDEA